jgi:undecaprenyl-diphosphatase
MLASCSVFAIFAAHLLNPQLAQFDKTIIDFIYTLRSPAMNTSMIVITEFGGDILIIIAAVVLIGLIIKKHSKEAILFWFLATFGTILNQLLKNIYQRPRPDNLPIMILTSYSFPSGHSMISFIFYLSLAYFTYNHLKNKKIGIILGVLFSILVLSIGISRIYLGVHYPSDVIAGYAAGLSWLFLALTAEKTYLLLISLKNYKSSLEA